MAFGFGRFGGCFDVHPSHTPSNWSLPVVFQADRLNKGIGEECAGGKDSGGMRSAREEGGIVPWRFPKR